MKIASFNINNIRKRLPNLLDWLREAGPDVVCLQELKATDVEFPAEAIRQAGYEAVWRGQKSWNGVAILARWAPVLTCSALPGDPSDTPSRYIEATVNGVIIASIYAPNGNPQPGPKFIYKLAWLKRLTPPSSMPPACRWCSRETTMACLPIWTFILPNPGTRMLCYSRRAARPTPIFSRRAGWMRSGRSIPKSRCTPIGTTCGNAGSAMAACALTICS